MRQMVSGFAIGSFSVTMFIVPFLMMALNIAPNYSTALTQLADESGITQPLQIASMQARNYRNQLVHPITDYVGHHLFPQLPAFPRLPK